MLVIFLKRTCALLIIVALGAMVSTAAAAPPLPDLPIPQSFGVNIHFIDNDLTENMTFLKEAGIGWVRQDLFWDKVEHRAGVYDFAAYDRLVDAAQQAGVRIVFILDYANPLYDHGLAPFTSKGRAAFARFAAAAAKHYADKDVVWELWNEPNIEIFWKPEPDVAQYIALADSATAAIRKVAPDVAIIGPGLSGPYLKDKTSKPVLAYLRRVLASKAAHDWSAITVHPYRFKGGPESAAPQLEAIRGMMRDEGIDPQTVPVMASEWGYSTWQRGVDEQTQAAYAVRELLGAASESMPFTIWYDWIDDGPTNLDREYRFGLLRAQSSNPSDREKPAFKAVKQTSTLLYGFRVTRRIDSEPGTFVLALQKDDRHAFAVWSVDDAPHDVELALPQGQWTAWHLLLGSTDLTAEFGQPVTVVSDRMPTIILLPTP